jgi:hypothetical protein
MINITVPNAGLYAISLGPDGVNYEATEVITRDAARKTVFAVCQQGYRDKVRAVLSVYGARNLEGIADADLTKFIKILRVIAA